MTSTREAIQSFEQRLDKELASKAIFKYDAASVVRDSAGAISLAASEASNGLRSPAIADHLSRGFHVALPRLIRSSGGRKVDGLFASRLIGDLLFMSDYYMLREYFYYTYNSPDSFEWEFEGNSIQVRFKDRSIPRQFAQYHNSTVLNLAEFDPKMSALADEVRTLLRGKEELSPGKHMARGLELAAQEADIRISTQFEILGGSNSRVELNGYRYSSLFAVYRFLLTKAIYHQHWAEANDTWTTFMFSKKLLAHEIALNSSLTMPEVVRVLRNLSYSKEQQKIPPMHFGIIDHQDLPDYIISCDQFIRSDGFAQALRVQAARSPEFFLHNVSRTLGENFVELVASRFRDAGFLIRKNVSLAELSPGLPDIDLLMVSREPTLGYYVFVCEVKATLPASWAKDYLRVLRADSLPKAFGQVTAVLNALGTPRGKDFLLSQVFSLDSDRIQEGLILTRALVITSQNSGMFFEEMSKHVKVIDYNTLSLLLRRCDGDLLYLLKAFNGLGDLFNTHATELSLDVGDISVTYEVVATPDVIDFPYNSWKSVGRDIEVADEFYREGGSPFDVLPYLKLNRKAT